MTYTEVNRTQICVFKTSRFFTNTFAAIRRAEIQINEDIDKNLRKIFRLKGQYKDDAYLRRKNESQYTGKNMYAKMYKSQIKTSS